MGRVDYARGVSRVPAALLRVLPTEKGMEFSFGGMSDLDVGNFLGGFFLSRGFVLGSGSPIAGVYETGSAVGRAVLGGFVKRQKYSLNVWSDPSATHARIHSEMSGASGSVVGVVRERRGRDDIKTDLQWFVQSAFASGHLLSAQFSAGQNQSPPPSVLPVPQPDTFARTQPNPSPIPQVGSLSVELARLASLHREGRLTDQEFEAAKRQLLGR
jgi:hypothetical protein